MASQSTENEEAVWASTVESIYINILVDEVNKGNQKNGIYPPKIWKLILNEVNQKGRRNFSLKQIKQKYNRLRLKHRLFSDLIQHTGFGWDAETNTVTAEDAVWDAYLAKRPEAHQFRKKGCDHYKLLGIIFNRSTATGVLHHASTMDPPNSDEEQHLDNEYINTGVHIDVEVNSQEEDVAENTNYSSRSGKRTTPVPARKSKKDRKDEIGEALIAWAESAKAKTELSLAKAERYRSSKSDDASATSVNYSLPRCVEVLSEMENITNEVYLAALEKFTNDDWRMIFLTMPIDRRQAWLNSLV